MKEFVSRLKIRAKLLVAFGSIVLLSVFLLFFSVRSIDKIILLKTVNEEVDALETYLEKMNHASKEFIYEDFKSDEFAKHKTSPAITKFYQNSEEALKVLDTIHNLKILENTHEAEVIEFLSTNLENLKISFTQVTDLLKERGFKDTGLEGQLRGAIHHVENSGFELNKADLLTLRRNEKDFFLRKDLKYRNDFNANLQLFIKSIQKSAKRDAPVILQEIDNYGKQFNNIVEIEIKIGLKENEGIRGSLRKGFQEVMPALIQFKTLVKETNEQQIRYAKIILFIIFFVQLIGGFALAIVYSNLLVKAIKEIRNAMQKLAQGIFPEPLTIKTTEEIGQTKLAFNQFIERLTVATNFAERLGDEQLKAVYPKKYSDDVLAKAIIAMQTKLSEVEEKQSKINWANLGAAQFNDVLKSEGEEVKALGDKILKFIVSYLNANQGALYVHVKTSDEGFLERISTYAYHKKRFVDDRILIGHGFVGQCFLEKATIHLKDVPKDFVKITSGLGEATPRHVLIVPLKIRKEVMGILEIASFETLETHQIEFTEKIAESIAMILSNKQVEEETKRLLTESQERSNTLMQQEEEMRQNAEELQATQEQMERQRMEMVAEIQLLKSKLKPEGVPVSLELSY